MDSLIDGSVTMDRINELYDLWREDSEVNTLNPGDALIDIPKLHYKYVHILSVYRMKSKNFEMERSNLRTLKYDYYMGRMDESDLKKHGWEPFPLVLKADVNMYMEGDKDLHKIAYKKSICDEIVEVCTSILKELNARTYQLRDYIAWQKFTQGI